jgi:LEA14-like dessication related protein
LAILVLPLASAWGFDVPKPTAEITSFRLEALSLRDATFSFDLAVKNPYPVDLPVSGLTLDFAVEGEKVFHTANQGKFSVPANKKKTNTFLVILPYEGIISLVKNYLDKDWLDTVISGKLTIPLPKLPGLPKEVSFDYKLQQKIPALKPEVTLLAFAVQGPTEAQIAEATKKQASKLSPKDVYKAFQSILAGKKPETKIKPQDLDVPFTITYVLSIENKAKAPLGFKSMGYTLDVNDEHLVEGESAEVRQQGTKTLVTVANTFRSKQLSEGLQQIFQARQGRFHVTGKASLQVPPSVRKEPVPLDFDETGAFSF